MRLSITLVLAGLCFAQGAGRSTDLVFCCHPDNDLYRVCTAKAAWLRCGTSAEAVENAPRGAGVLILADGYPNAPTVVDADVLTAARAKGLRLYIEYPAALPGIELGEPRGIAWGRGVVASDQLGEALPEHLILAIHGCRFLPTQAEDPWIVMARVAGYDTAVIGLPDETYPILFGHPRGDMLVATTQLSRFVTGRYAPTKAWAAVWAGILGRLAPGSEMPALEWTPTVRPTYGRDDVLPGDVGARAVRRGAGWYRKSRLLVHPSREADIQALVDKGLESGPQPPPEMPTGDGSRGILEGYQSAIDENGEQRQRLIRRSDCQGESAMAMAFAGGELADIARRILDYWYFESKATKGFRADPDHPAYGLIAWGTTTPNWEKAFYGDDNARLILGTAAASALLDTDTYDEAMMKCLLANLRTTGRLGFRRNRIDVGPLEKNGWRSYFDDATISYAPHYQANLWSAYLWAYHKTGYKLFLDRARQAIAMTMKAYPDEWRWTGTITDDQSRMLLALAWLVQVEDTREHRGWLKRMATDFLASQAECGAIRDTLGPPGHGRYTPPKSNERYGVTEACLIQADGDPAADMLYVCNFGFLGLHEAAAATGDPFYREAEDKLAEFLCRIQVRSDTHPELDGAWFRAFDFRRWEYWASNADIGWGAWCVETGWSQAWITAVLGLREKKTSLWDLISQSRIGDHFEKLYPQMFPDGDTPKLPAPTRSPHALIRQPHVQ